MVRDEKRMGIPRKQENPEKRKDGDIGETKLVPDVRIIVFRIKGREVV